MTNNLTELISTLNELADDGRCSWSASPYSTGRGLRPLRVQARTDGCTIQFWADGYVSARVGEPGTSYVLNRTNDDSVRELVHKVGDDLGYPIETPREDESMEIAIGKVLECLRQGDGTNGSPE